MPGLYKISIFNFVESPYCFPLPDDWINKMKQINTMDD